MALNINNVVLAGIVKFVKVSETSAGKLMAAMKVAVSEVYNDKVYTHTIDVKAWGNSAAKAQQIQAGDAVVVNGRLQHRKYNTEGGEEKETWEVVANGLDFEPAPRAATPATRTEPAPNPSLEDDVPF